MDVQETQIPEGTHVLAILDATGDSKIMWDKNRPDEVEVARTSFNTLRKKGYLIYKVTGKDGEKGEMMVDFDPYAERLIATPAPVGG